MVSPKKAAAVPEASVSASKRSRGSRSFQCKLHEYVDFFLPFITTSNSKIICIGLL